MTSSHVERIRGSEGASYLSVELPIPGSPTLVVTPARVLAVSVGNKRGAHLRSGDVSPAFRAFVRDAAQTRQRRAPD